MPECCPRGDPEACSPATGPAPADRGHRRRTLKRSGRWRNALDPAGTELSVCSGGQRGVLRPASSPPSPAPWSRTTPLRPSRPSLVSLDGAVPPRWMLRSLPWLVHPNPPGAGPLAVVVGEVPAGRHRVKGVKAGQKDWVREVEVAATQPTEVMIDIEPLGPPEAVQAALPALKVTKSGADRGIPGRQVTYTIAVSNSGLAAATNTGVSNTIPVGTRFIGSSPVGTLSSNTVT